MGEINQTVTISETEYQFLKSQNEKLKNQNRSLQKELKAKNKKITRLKKQNIHLAQSKGDVYIDYVYADNRAIEFEELGWERLEQLEKYEKAFNEIKNFSDELDDYLQGYHQEWALNKQIQEVLQEFENEILKQ